MGLGESGPFPYGGFFERKRLFVRSGTGILTLSVAYGMILVNNDERIKEPNGKNARV